MSFLNEIIYSIMNLERALLFYKFCYTISFEKLGF